MSSFPTQGLYFRDSEMISKKSDFQGIPNLEEITPSLYFALNDSGIWAPKGEKNLVKVRKLQVNKELRSTVHSKPPLCFDFFNVGNEKKRFNDETFKRNL